MSRRFALLVATYEHDDPGLSRLTAPAHDAEALAEVLRDPAVAGFDVTLLVNEPHYRVGEAVGDLFDSRRSDDLVLLYFTGHGLKDEDGRLYLAMRNTRRGSLLFTSLPAEQVDQAMSGSDSRRKVLILDCCYSGAFPAARLAKSDPQVHALEPFQGRGRTVLTASDAMQYSYEGDRLSGSAVQSVFTRHLVTGLREGAADLDGDGDITLDELYRYVHDRVVDEMPQQRPKRQDDVEGRIVIARNVYWALPTYLRNALDSPVPDDRLSALDGLAHLRRVGNEMVQAKVGEHIETLARDDSRKVSAAARELLGRGPSVEVTAETAVTDEQVVEASEVSAPQASGEDVPELRRGPELRAVAGLLRERFLAGARTGARRVGAGAYAFGLRGVAGVLAVLASALMIQGLLRYPEVFSPFGPGPRGGIGWYVAGTSAVALAAAILQILPGTRTTGAGALMGAAAASVWGLVYLTEDATADYDLFRDAARLQLAGHAVLLTAAVVAAFALVRAREAALDLRPPRGVRSWVVLGGACGVVLVGILASALLLHQFAGLRQVSPRPEIPHWSHAFFVTGVTGAVVPVCAAVLVPRRFGQALLFGWAAVTLAVTTATYVWLGWFEEPLGNAVLAAAVPMALAALATVLARWGGTVEGPPRRSGWRVLVASLVVLPALSVGGGVLAGRTADRTAVTPLDVAYSKDGKSLYVTTELYWAVVAADDDPPGSISVVDAASGRTIKGPVALDAAASDVARSDDGRYLYLVQPKTRTVTVFAAQEMEPVGTPLRLGGTPVRIEVAPDHRAWVFSKSPDEAASIDTGTDKVAERRIPLGKEWSDATVSPDGRRLYVAQGTSVSVIDPDTGKAVGAPIELGAKPVALTADPADDTRLYAVVETGDRELNNERSLVAALDTRSGLVQGMADLPYAYRHSMVVSRDGQRLYVMHNLFDGGSVSVVDTRTMKVLAKPVDVGQPPMSIAISPGGDRVWLALFRDLASFRTVTPHSVSHFAVQAP
ncbi:YVTN family beta-propeller protein [Streptomyces canus]|uniref:YVTN family beta-propeller protein n=1 Tax=Streptomyces canus TaxID=58343 RepID=A0AAW8FHF5_9ACTN|nr:caspase family protein [Streptomyces canus]MDQ0909587.1 YVTN family beta-propeller protein [Streptomyces canus]